MKKVLAALISIVLVLMSTACSAPSTDKPSNADSSAPGSAAEGGEILVGHFGPLTGTLSTSGQEGEKGARLRVKQINDAGGINGKKIKFIAYDDKGNAEAAVKAATRLIEEDKIQIILGSQLSGNIQACGERVEKAQIPLVGTGVSPVWLQQGWTYLFRALSNSKGGIEPLVNAMETLGISKLATIVYQDEGNRSSSAMMVEEIKKRGKIEITAEEVWQPNDTDWTGQFSKIISTNPNGVMIFGQGEQAGPMMKQLRSMGYKGYCFGPETMSLPDIRTIAGSDADGMVFFAPHCIPDTADEANSDKEREFLEAFVLEYGALPISDVAYRTYDAMTVIEEGLRKAKSLSGADIRDAIKNTSGLQLLAGTMDYTKFDNGEGMSGMQVFITHKGKNVRLDNFLKDNAADTYK